MDLNDQKGRLAKERIEAAIYELKNRYPEFIYPLSMLEWKKCEKGQNTALATDGITCFYDTTLVLQKNSKKLQSEIVHILLHGLLGHFQMKDMYKDIDCRDIVMDVQVRYFMQRFQMYSDRNEMLSFDSLFEKSYSMGQYFQLLNNPNVAMNKNFYRSICKVDDHEIWNQRNTSMQKKQLVSFWKDIQKVIFGEVFETGEENKQLKKVDAVLSAHNKKGDNFGGENFGEEEFEVGLEGIQDYREMLKNLFAIKEINREEPDSIDPMFYHYGLELYEDMPLVEPLEYCEKPMFQTLVIAVDVSGSCTTRIIMEKFWGETFQCISQLKEQQAEGRILLLECDDHIQSEEWIELSEFTETPKKMKVVGRGGTSFVPVFDRIEALKEEGTQIDALLYLTDGEGVYPKKKPDFPVYFVLEENDVKYRWNFSMPDWITKVYLEKGGH